MEGTLIKSAGEKLGGTVNTKKRITFKIGLWGYKNRLNAMERIRDWE